MQRYENTHTQGGDVGMGGILVMQMKEERRQAWRKSFGVVSAHVRHLCAAGAGLAVLLCTMVATARNESGAEMLFQAGRDAMARGDLKEACLKFKESHEVAPAPGTVLNLGNCEELRGRLATAWDYFTQAMGMLEQGDPRYTVAERRAQALEKRVPRIIIELSPSAPSASRVFRAGEAITTLGQPLRLDPGEHTITVEAPGYAGGAFSVTLAEGDVETVVVNPGEHIAIANRQNPAATNENETEALPWVILGAGAVSLAGAGVLGTLSYVRWNTVQSHCDLTVTPHVCDADGIEAQSQGKTMGIVAAGLGVVAVTSVVLYFTLPLQESPATVTAGQFGTFTGVRVNGSF
jgi:hypothetical protein